MKTLQRPRSAREAERRRENARKTREAAELEFPNEKFIADNAEFQAKNRFTQGLIIPQNVKVAESRVPISAEQRRTLNKELRQAGILARLGNFVYLTPERTRYKQKVTDALVNGVPFEFRNVENKVRKIETRFGKAKEKGNDVNVFLNIDANISIHEVRRRIGLVLGRHPEYTGKIIVAIDGGNPYFWDADSFREKKPLPCSRVRYPGRN